jgi:transcriptional regulator with XRE-family HTH domain
MLQYDRVEVGKYLKASRENADLTQAQVSRMCGYGSPQFISNIERGVSVASLDLLGRLVRLYKADVEQLEKIIIKSQKELLMHKFKLVGKRRTL